MASFRRFSSRYEPRIPSRYRKGGADMFKTIADAKAWYDSSPYPNIWDIDPIHKRELFALLAEMAESPEEAEALIMILIKAHIDCPVGKIARVTP